MTSKVKRADFTHKGLNIAQESIRLISLKPHLSPDGLVQCTIRHATVDAQYVCLSYRWGLPDLSRMILVNGRRMRINVNLHDFLENARTRIWPGCKRYRLWIDAICVDQISETERVHQIAQMGRVYSKAKQVVVWLWRIVEVPGNEEPAREYVSFILKNEYWTRAWIVQEMILAQHAVLMVGNHLIPLSALITSALSPTLFPKRNDGLSGEMPSILLAWQHAKKDRRHGKKKPSLIYWLNASRDTKCERLHDRVFSVLGLAEEGADITVSYSTPLVKLAHQVL
ncbi:hypothetical protein E8E11_009924 [Didymella keratinophila]|nr:hypothetical protein E8E11_009924 [Didymella keratinophila]